MGRIRRDVVFLQILCALTFDMTSAQFHVRGGFTIGDNVDNVYTLQWEVHHNFISFQAEAKGTGYIGFGISPTGKGMTDSDLFLSGIFSNGTVYGYDAHGGAEMDEMKNYILLFAAEDPVRGYTVVHFQRLINTGDMKDDIAIMNEPQWIMWSIGPQMDVLETHGVENRGFVLVNLLNPPIFHSYYKTDKQKEAAAMMSKQVDTSENKPEMQMSLSETIPIPVAE